jgi:hypothetical protein
MSVKVNLDSLYGDDVPLNERLDQMDDPKALGMEMASLDADEINRLPSEILDKFQDHQPFDEFDQVIANTTKNVRGNADSKVAFICRYLYGPNGSKTKIRFSFGFVPKFQSLRYGNNIQNNQNQEFVFAAFKMDIVDYNENENGDILKSWSRIFIGDNDFETVRTALGFNKGEPNTKFNETRVNNIVRQLAMYEDRTTVLLLCNQVMKTRMEKYKKDVNNNRRP